MTGFYSLFPDCKVIMGYKYAVIVDLQKGRAKQIPSEIGRIISKFNNKRIDLFTTYLSKKGISEEQSINLLNDLAKSGFIQNSNSPLPFTKMPVEWDSPYQITNCIVDYSSSSKYNLESLFKLLKTINCPYFQMRIFDHQTIFFLENVLSEFGKLESLEGLEIILPFDEEIHFEELFELYSFVSLVIVYSATKNKKIQKHTFDLEYIESGINKSSCGLIDPSFFIINADFYSESLEFNSCLNRKLSIDEYGYIKNCPSMDATYGHVDDVPTLTKIINDKSFTKYWNIHKNVILKCKDCEFRLICSDCRAYLEDSENILSKPLKCGYDPYNGIWEDWKKIPANLAKAEKYKIN